MTLSEVYDNLCYYDKRNPLYDDEGDREPRTYCYCNNCYQRRDGLALEILRLKEELKYDTTTIHQEKQK